MTEDQVRALVDRKARPNRNQWCEATGVRKSHLSEFMAGKRRPTTDVLNALGLEYRIVRKRKETSR